MKPLRVVARDLILPVTAFVVTVAIHFLRTTRPPASVVVESPWVSLPVEEVSRLTRYLEAGGYWMAWSYGISFSFAAIALRRFLRRRTAAGGSFALGGATFTGLLAFFGCYMTGCCGSPMLVVYLNLFGAGFLPFAKPFVAALTTLSVLGAWWWMTRGDRKRGTCCASDRCACG